ncbi:unnamed protein product [Rhodiola kirilowii]
MAQKTENEDTEFKSVPETLTPCTNNCGLTSNASTNNMCLNCFTNAATSSSSSSTSSSSVSTSFHFVTDAKPSHEMKPEPDIETRIGTPETHPVANREVNRCSGCKKKVGLTGFRCRCGDLFCSKHRYSDRHECSYDYKAAGKEAIARENPLVRAARIAGI